MHHYRAIFCLVACILRLINSQVLVEDALPAEGNTVFVSASPDMAAALATSGVEEITLLKNVNLANISDRLPITLSGRNITILGLDSTPLYGPDPPTSSISPTILHFGSAIPALIIEDGTVLTLRNLVLKGIASKRTPGLKETQLPFPVGFELFPTVVVYPDTSVIFQNVIITEFLSSCAEPALQQLSINIASIFGGQQFAGYVADPPTVWLRGRHTIPIVVKAANDTALGTMTVISDGVAFACLQDPLTPKNQEPGAALVVTDANGSSYPSITIPEHRDDHLPASAVAGIAVGVTVAVIAVVVASALIWRRKQRHQLFASRKGTINITAIGTASKESNEMIYNYSNGGGGAGGSVHDAQHHHRVSVELYRPSDKAAAVQAEIHQLSVASALRIRFGSLEGLEIGHLIGRGAHGRIYKGSIRGAPVAVKVVEHTIEPGNAAAAESITSEAVLLTALAHPNIVRVFRVATIKLREAHSGRLSSGGVDLESSVGSDRTSYMSVDGQISNGSTSTTEPTGILGVTGPGLYETWLVMEFCEKGSLYGAMKRKKIYTANGAPNRTALLNILIDVAEGMEFLHSGPRAVLHGDLKPANILLKAGSEPGSVTAVVADFGLSRMLDSDEKHSIQRTASLGTVQYMSPELLSAGRLTRAADVWAFGIMLIELWEGESAFEDMTAAQVFYSVVQLKQQPRLPADCPKKYAALIRGCLKQEPEERIDFKHILKQLREILDDL
ncbi:hypothetical protein Ndes2526B_g03247 [Nannochloris sp. 'desiccata']